MSKLNIRNQVSLRILQIFYNSRLVLSIWLFIMPGYCKNTDAKTEMIKKKKRAASKHVAELSLEDLSKYFGLTIVEASRNLNIGLTVLKKKCREFGIPRWPHRKIKSLDSLIHDLQVFSLHSSNTSIH